MLKINKMASPIDDIYAKNLADKIIEYEGKIEIIFSAVKEKNLKIEDFEKIANLNISPVQKIEELIKVSVENNFKKKET